MTAVCTEALWSVIGNAGDYDSSHLVLRSLLDHSGFHLLSYWFQIVSEIKDVYTSAVKDFNRDYSSNHTLAVFHEEVSYHCSFQEQSAASILLEYQPRPVH